LVQLSLPLLMMLLSLLRRANRSRIGRENSYYRKAVPQPRRLDPAII
jgi:hypothetical protein